MQEIIESPRLRLRKPELTDAPALNTLLQAPEITRMTASIPLHTSELAMEFWVMQQQANWYRKLAFNYVVIHEGILIGVMGLFQNSENDIELGYWIGKPYWGHGYASEAAMAILNAGFTALNLNHIDAGYFADNPVSGKVLEKMGFDHKNKTSNLFSVARGCRGHGIELRLQRKTFMNRYKQTTTQEKAIIAS